MIASSGNKSQFIAVRRPALPKTRAAYDQLRRLFLSVQRRQPQTAIAQVSTNSLFRNPRVMAGVNLLWITASPRNLIYRLLHSGGIAGRIGRSSGVILPSTPRIDDGAGVGRKLQRRKLLPIFFKIRGQPARFEVRRLCHKNIAFALLVQHPRDARRRFCRSQIAGKRRTHDLFQRERLLRRRARGHDQKHQTNLKDQCCKTITAARLNLHCSPSNLPAAVPWPSAKKLWAQQGGQKSA